MLHAVDLRHCPYPLEKVRRERRAVVADQHVLWAAWDVMQAVLQKGFVDALDVFIHGAHFRWIYELGREAKPCVLVPFARIINELNRIFILTVVFVWQIVLLLLVVVVSVVASVLVVLLRASSRCSSAHCVAHTVILVPALH
jgi:hypothetical protein